MATDTINNDIDVYYGKMSVITSEGKQPAQPAVFIGSNEHEFDDMAFTIPEVRDFISKLSDAADKAQAELAAGKLED
jgi:hypothetical protein